MNEKIDNMKLESIMQNKGAFEKLMLAYWVSVPTDADKAPDKIIVTDVINGKIRYEKVSRDIKYGYGITTTKELEKYIKRIKIVNEKNDSIFDMFDKTKGENAWKKK